MSWKLHPKAIRPIGSAAKSSFIDLLAARLVDIEKEIDILKSKRDWLFQEGVMHGYDKKTIRDRSKAHLT